MVYVYNRKKRGMVPGIGLWAISFGLGREHVGAERWFRGQRDDDESERADSSRGKVTTKSRRQRVSVRLKFPSHPPVIFTNGWAKGGGGVEWLLASVARGGVCQSRLIFLEDVWSGAEVAGGGGTYPPTYPPSRVYRSTRRDINTSKYFVNRRTR